MPQPSLEKFTRRGVLLKEQADPNVPETLDANTDGILLYDGSSGTEVDTVEENPDRPYFGGQSQVIANKRAFITGEVRLVPPTSPGDAVNGTPNCDIALRPAGMARVLDAGNKITRYNPITEGIPITTGAFYHAGTLLKPYAARHSLSGISLEIGQRAKAQLRIQGDYDSFTKVVLPTIPVPDEIGAVLAASNSVTQIRVDEDEGSWLNVLGKALSIDHGTGLNTKEYTELKETGIDSRQGTFTLRIAKTDLDDFNPVQVRDEARIFEATLRVTDADNLYTMIGVRAQILGVNAVNIDGDYGWELTGPCRASAVGGDEHFIEFGDLNP